MLWQVSSFPHCRFHAFLSHSSEDKPWLVEPLDAMLQARGEIPWFDRRHYPLAGDPYAGLRDGILFSRFTVFLVTLATLANQRGWQAMERAYARIVQDNLIVGGTELSRVELPLFFVPRDRPELSRSIWFPLTATAQAHFHGPADGDPVVWAADRITRFRTRQETEGAIMVHSIAGDPVLSDFVDSRPGMRSRIEARYP